MDRSVARNQVMLLAVVFCTTVAAVGCARWAPDAGDLFGPSENSVRKEQATGLPEVQLAKDAAVIEVVVVPLSELRNVVPTRQAYGAAPLLPGLDETLLPTELRRRLKRNGLRAGRLSGIDLTGPFDSEAVAGEMRLLQQANVESDFDTKLQEFACVDGKTHTLAIRRPYAGELALLVNTAHDGIVGETLSNAQFNVQLQSVMLDDGRLSLRLTPEVTYGQAKPNIIANESLAFRFDYTRPKWSLNELTVDVPLSTGQAMVLFPLEPAFGIGEQMLVGKRADQTPQQMAVIVRLKRMPKSTLQ